ncbi:unnamed protein product [Phytomonas sp. Hart1]|nr:unnamed protein product [Phytomonas sp. Hart1]|eukprot:CCW70448.1 unnamed protein product [Phytomonas sp. isolate Hart1]
MTSSIFFYKPLDGPKLGVSNRLIMRNGETIPQLGFGTYRLHQSEVEAAITYAISCGFRHIDCAKAYFNQKEVGIALQKGFKNMLAKREDMFITSKLWSTDQHPDNVESACRETLKELQLDYLDLYLIHWPVCWRYSPKFKTEDDKYPKNSDGSPAIVENVSLSDTWKAMSELVDKGIVHSIGLSNCNEKHLKEVMKQDSLNAPVLNQIEFHPALVDHGLVACNKRNNLLTAAYCPLGMATRTTPPEFVPLPNEATIKRLAERSGFSPQRLLLNWNLDHSNVVIVKSSKEEHIKSNSMAARFALSDATRLVLDGYQESIAKFRVMNPKNFTQLGKSFFT